MPFQIRIATDIAYIQFERKTENDKITRFMKFYKLPSFKLVDTHGLVNTGRHLFGPILVLNSMFYLYGAGFIFFDKNCNIMNPTKKIFGKINNSNSDMIFFNNA